MKKLLYINLYIDGEKFAQCDYIQLAPCAHSTARKFLFKNLKFKKKLNLCYKDKIKINISCRTRNKNYRYPVSEFKILLLAFDKNLQWAYGLVYDDYEMEYRQGVIDVFKSWEKGEKIDWFSLPLQVPLKEDYIYACFCYSSVSTEIIDKDIYQIDMSGVREYRDVIYLLSEEFFGERGYMGHFFHPFTDCLLQISREKDLKGKKIIFKNTKHLSIIDDETFFEDVKEQFLMYEFTVLTEEQTC